MPDFFFSGEWMLLLWFGFALIAAGLTFYGLSYAFREQDRPYAGNHRKENDRGNHART